MKIVLTLITRFPDGKPHYIELEGKIENNTTNLQTLWDVERSINHETSKVRAHIQIQEEKT